MTVLGVGGRPFAFNSPEEMQKKIEAYFNYCDEQKETIISDKGNIKVIQKPYTISGLCLYLGITRETINQYSKKLEYAAILANAKSKVENYCEENTMSGKLNPIFSIFSLKNNFGWTDRIEVNSNSQPEQLNASDIKKVLGRKGKQGQDE